MMGESVILLASARLRTYLPWTSVVPFSPCETEVGMAAFGSVTLPVAESGPDSLAPHNAFGNKDLARLDDRALLIIVRSLPRASERRGAACELLVTRHQGLVWSCVRPYLRSP